MLHPREQLQLIFPAIFPQPVNRLIPAFRRKGVVNLRTAEEKRRLQIAEVVFFEECGMCEAADLTCAVCEGVANVWGAEAVSASSVCGLRDFSKYAYPTQAYFVAA